MKKLSINSVIKISSIFMALFTAMFNPAYSQMSAADADINSYTVTLSSTQKATFRLPKDIRSGDMITGSVIEETAKASSANISSSSTISGVVVEINGKQATLNNNTFSFLVPAGAAAIPFVLKTTAGTVLTQGQVPVMPFSSNASIFHLASNTIPTFTAEPIGQPGEILRVTGKFDGNAANTKVSLNGQPVQLLVATARQINFLVPENATTGSAVLRIEENGNTQVSKLNIAYLNASADKLTLRRGEKTTIHVTISGLDGVDMNTAGYQLRIENNSPQTIAFAKGNDNVIVKELNQGNVTNGVFEYSTRITGLSSGLYGVGIKLFKPASKNPCVDEYYDAIKIIDEEFEAHNQQCKKGAVGDAMSHARCLAPYEKERDQQKKDAITKLIACMKG